MVFDRDFPVEFNNMASIWLHRDFIGPMLRSKPSDKVSVAADEEAAAQRRKANSDEAALKRWMVPRQLS